MKKCTKSDCDIQTEGRSWCRSCKLKYQKDHYKRTREVRLAKGRAYKEKNRHKILAYKKRNRDENKEAIREYRKQWRLKNIESVKIKKKAYRKNYLKDPRRKLECSFRGQIKRAFDKNYKSGTWRSLLGCSIDACKKHLESKFQLGMTWENHGNKGWHIDHIRPISSFSDENLKDAFHFSNLQPLWAVDNLIKGSKISA